MADRLVLEVSDTNRGNRARVGLRPSLEYYACGKITNLGPFKATLTLTLTPLGPNGEGYPVTVPGGSTEEYPSGAGRVGCGFVSALDYDATHQEAKRYRLRVDGVWEDGLRGSIEKEAGITDLFPAPPPVVISRFRTSGGSGQYIEIQNISSVTVQMTDVYVDVWMPRRPDDSSYGTLFYPFTGSIGPGCRWLIGEIFTSNSPRSVDGVPIDGSLGFGLNSDGGIALRAANGRVIDQVAMNPASGFKEGQALAPLSLGDVYTRVADTGNNATDFRLNAGGSPRNTTSACTAPFQ